MNGNAPRPTDAADVYRRDLPFSAPVASAAVEAGAAEGDEIDLRKVVEALARRRRLALSVLVASLVVGAAITAWQRAFQPIFSGSFKLLVSDPINAEERNSGSDGEALAQYALPERGSTNTATLLQVLTSPMLLGPVEERMGLKPGSLAANLGITTGREKDGILNVTLTWRDAVVGNEILADLSKTYLAFSLRQRQEKLNQGLAFLDQQAPELQDRVNRLQSQMASLRRSSGFVEPQDQASAILSKRAALSGQLDNLQQEQARLQGQLASVQQGHLSAGQGSPTLLDAPRGAQPGSRVPEAAPAMPPGATPGVSSEPLQELNSVEDALAEARANFTESSPQVQELLAKRDRLRPLLQRRLAGELQAELNQNRSQQRTIQAQLRQLGGAFSTTPDQIKTYESLQQQLEVARENLSSYIKTRENFRLQVAQRTVPWSVIAPPRFAVVPVFPNLPRNLALSLLLGAGGGAALALLRDRLDPVFHDPAELRQSLAYPLLGTVPYLPWARNATVVQAIDAMAGSERFEIRESLRNLFANFRLLRADKTLRLVALTSATQGEGKSTTTTLFATTLAQLGQRVLLVDADMRRPMLHRYIGAENGAGLSSLLTDSSLHPAALIQTVAPGLDLLSAGPIPPDTTRLLSSGRCGEVLEAIRALPGYDLVLFDTPPALLLSDPVLLAGHLDGLLFVVGMGRVNRDLPGLALERMGGTGVDVLGMLANLPTKRLSSRGGYGYGYRYGYGYGYGYGTNRYGGYEELASRYQSSPEAEAATERPTARSVLRRAPSPMSRGARRLARWLDRRD